MRLDVALLLAVVVVAGCATSSGEAYVNAFAAGRRAYHAGRYEEAAKAFDEAARHAERLKDRDEARFLRARVLERAGRDQEAKEELETLVRQSPNGPRTVRAEFEIIRMEIEHGDMEAGYVRLFEVVKKHPGHGVSRLALERMIQHEVEQRGEEAALAWARSKVSSFRGTDLEQVIEYRVARLLEQLGQIEQARDAYVATAKAHPYPSGGLTDDAFVRAAKIDKQLGRYEQAIELLRTLLSSREHAQLGSSYERPRFPEAQYEIGLIYRDGIGDRAAARREFRKLHEEHRTSILRDDAMWAEARLARAEGDDEAACLVLERLSEQLPDSRYVSCVRLICAKAPLGSRGKECPEYIRRDVEKNPSGEQKEGSSREDDDE